MSDALHERQLGPRPFEALPPVRANLESQREDAISLPGKREIIDKAGRKVLERIMAIDESAVAQKEFDRADRLRFGSNAERHESAFVYYALAFLSIYRKIEIRYEKEPVDARILFHFAGHMFRTIGQLDLAADAYWRAGVVRGASVDKFSVRSLARAKVCFRASGEFERADRLHILEWDARSCITNGSFRKAVISLWRFTTKYGTSFKDWTSCVVVYTLAASMAVEVLHHLDAVSSHVDGATWKPFLTPIYFCLVTLSTVGYGDITPATPAGQVFAIAHMAISYVLLAFGFTILGRKVAGQ